MYNSIVNPITNRNISIHSKLGKNIFKKYIIMLLGGETSQLSKKATKLYKAAQLSKQATKPDNAAQLLKDIVKLKADADKLKKKSDSDSDSDSDSVSYSDLDNVKYNDNDLIHQKIVELNHSSLEQNTIPRKSPYQGRAFYPECE